MSPQRFLSVKMVAVLVTALIVPTSPAQTPAGKAVVKGTFVGDGKDGKIRYLIAQAREPFSDKAAIRLVFTEKDPASSEKPDFDAGFKKLGSALILSVFRDGGIFGCEVAHTALPKSPFSSLGKIEMKEFKVSDNHVTGHVSTGGEQDAFGQKWAVDLTFSAPLPKGAFAATSEPAPEEKKIDERETKPAVTGTKLPVGQLPLPAGARDVEYKQGVEHIAFHAEAPVSSVAADFSAKLKQKGWKEAPGGLMTKSNAILKRTLNGAELTIMVQPAGKGCTVKVFTEGLDWSKPPATNAAKPAQSRDANDIEAEANRVIEDALKQIPRLC